MDRSHLVSFRGFVQVFVPLRTRWAAMSNLMARRFAGISPALDLYTGIIKVSNEVLFAIEADDCEFDARIL